MNQTTLSVVLLIAACGGKPAADDATKLATAQAAPAAAPEAAKPVEPAKTVQKIDFSDELRSQVIELLAPYENMRGALAKDSVDGVAEAAKQIESRAAELSAEMSDPAQSVLSSIEWAAVALTEPNQDVAKTRVAFGDLSRAYVELLSAAPTLAQGQHVFECPMAPGYKKWIQPTAELANPYMGTKMLTCGSTSQWLALAN